jgi:hypothetical protein
MHTSLLIVHKHVGADAQTFCCFWSRKLVVSFLPWSLLFMCLEFSYAYSRAGSQTDSQARASRIMSNHPRIALHARAVSDLSVFRSRNLAFRNLPASLILRALTSANNFAEGGEDLCGAKAVAHPPTAWSPCTHSCSYIRVHSLTFCYRSLKLILIVMFFLACLCVLMSLRHLAEVARETHSAKAVTLHRPAYACVRSLPFCFRSSKGFKHRYI